MKLNIEEIVIPYNSEDLSKWKQGSIQIVPEYALEWDGPGISNGYGFGEHIAGNYFRNLGYEVIVNDYNLVSKTSKYKINNDLIASKIGQEKIKNFGEYTRGLIQRGFKIVTNLDLFIYNSDSCYFVEVKKEKDKLRQPQIRFIYLAQTLLKTTSKLIYLDDKCDKKYIHEKEFEVNL